MAGEALAWLSYFAGGVDGEPNDDCADSSFSTPSRHQSCAKRQYTSADRIDTLVNIIITLVVFTLLVLPIVVMYVVMGLRQRESPVDAIRKSYIPHAATLF